MNLQIINPLQIPNWDDLVLATGKASLFHSSAWARVLRESYGYKPLYFISFEDGRLSLLIPFMEISTWITGKRAVSLPFTDFCDSIAPDTKCFQDAVEQIKEYGRKKNWKTVEWRGNRRYFTEEAPSSSSYSHTLQLSGPEDQIFSRFKSNTRRNINKAVKEGVRVEIGDTLGSVKSYYRLHCITRRDHGLPPQPFAFFKKIHENVIAAGNGFNVLAFLKNLCVAGAVYLDFGKTAIYKFGASNKKYQHLRPNNLVMWEAIRECVKRGFRTLSFGRTETDNEGLLQFKRGWNPEEELVNYYKYDLNKNSFLDESMGVKGFYNRIFGMTPIPVLRFVGSAIYKHLG